MATLAPMRLDPQTRTYTIDPPGTCRVCGGDVPAVEVEISLVATPGERDGNTIPLDVNLTGTVVTATECGHVLNADSQSATKETPMDTEPPIGTVVSDKGDELWKRASHGWTYELRPGVWDSGRGSGLAWNDLVKHYGPVKVVPGD